LKDDNMLLGVVVGGLLIIAGLLVLAFMH
jgi:hypothetical protein